MSPLKTVLLLALVVGVAMVPAVMTLPTADACQPYQYYCPLDGRFHYACGTQIPSSCVMSILDP